MRRRRTLALLLAASAASLPAQAGEVWKAGDGKSALEARAFYKHFLAGLRMPPGLVEGTDALDGLLTTARARLPPEAAADLPASAPLPRYGDFSDHTARIWGRFSWHERLELQAGWQIDLITASDRALAGGVALGGSLPAVVAEPSKRRLVDFDTVLARSRVSLLQQNLDLLALKLHTSYADFVVGRQVLSWGSGRLWNPTDLLSPFAPTQIDREVRHGVDAVRVSIPLRATAELELLWLPQLEAKDQGAVLRSQFNVQGFDFAPSLAKYGRDVVAGLDAVGDLGPVGVHGEAAWTRALDLGPDGSREQFVRAVAGTDYQPKDGIVLTLEYYYNGFGAAEPSDYLEVLRSPRVRRGEVFGAGRHYLGLVASYRATELLTLQAITITNLADPSALLVPAVEYWAEQDLLVRLIATLPFGRQPDPSDLRRLTLTDVTLRNAAWERATGSLGLKSEFGASPWGVFAQVAAYFL